MTTIVLLRHAESEWNAEGRWQGHADPTLSPLGRRQAAELDLGAFDAIYSSDLKRATETAEIVAARLGLPVEYDARLREVDVGEWSGLTRAEIADRYPGASEWENGETRAAMGVRVLEAVLEIAAAHPDGRVLVVTHGGCLGAIWLACGGRAEERPRRSNCDVFEIAVEEGQVRRLDSVPGGGLHQQVQG